MKDIDNKLKALAWQDKLSLPQATETKLASTLESLPPINPKTYSIPHHRYTRGLSIVLSALALFLILPNVSPSIAYAMQKLPLIGGVVKVVTIRHYEYEDSYHSANASIPKVQLTAEANSSLQHSADLINGDVEELTSALLDRFNDEIEELGSEAHTALSIDYEVVTNTDSWFTLKLIVFEATGSSDTHYKYYHIDRATGSIVALPDLFKKNSSYIEAISKSIKQQMKDRMQSDDSMIYWLNSEYPEWDFTSIKENQNFYFSDSGNIVIVFDKYEVAPGSMGCPEFEIPKQVYEEYLLDK